MKIDIEKGIVDFGIIKVCITTKHEEFYALSGKLVTRAVTKKGSYFYYFISPIVKEGIPMNITIFFSYKENRSPTIEFRPYVTGNCIAVFNAGHKWMENVLNDRIYISNSMNNCNYQLYPYFKIRTSTICITSETGYHPIYEIEYGGTIDIKFE